MTCIITITAFYLLSLLHQINCHFSLAGHYYSLWMVLLLPSFCLLEGYCAQLSLISFILSLISFILYPSPWSIFSHGPFAERSDINRHRFVLPKQILFVTWLEILTTCCLIERLYFLIEHCVRAYWIPYVSVCLTK